MKQPTTGWAAVAHALDTRLRELRWHQNELARRSDVSQAIIRELQYNSIERNRSKRTLEALSIALGWHPDHLHAILHGTTPPHPDESEDAPHVLAPRLDAIEQRMNAMSTTLHDLRIDLALLLHHIRK
ncbi:helix-turn-helix domain-containing protein [Actinokineospora terrae]|uniref:Uncharacterized protein n=1 Tax=Actinokineospora terrae TaxID=155974 RepID=A0A1H9T519_9PSEU|nr:helix-turn-helix transcriptional regulator [Actinokineospora terrae]SER92258.1 hypothetical protein SAMN04487818_10677 [Actinokineospora terrae]